MLISYRWLCELLPDGSFDASEISDALTGVGLAVDAVVAYGEQLRSVVIAEVLSIAPHPSRDSLRLVTICTRRDDTQARMGSLAPRQVERVPSQLTVVCGAKNVPEPGGLVVFAGLGVKLPGVSFELTRREIGGVESEGMLVSESELGLAESSDGIVTFAPGTFEPGTSLLDALPEVNDTIFELDVTPNRPDALGHVGVARDLSAFFECDLALPSTTGIIEIGAPTDNELSCENLAQERCPRYAAGLVRGIKIGTSPDFMRWRLHRLGIRPISNVVDITNWLLLEFGQPMHAFDLKELRGAKVIVRNALDGETMTTLDGVKRSLAADDLLICDAQGPIALAGIMGGAESEIKEDTQDVLLECAYFSPTGIRRTARRQGMHTESSHRFERGCDHGAVTTVLARARYLMQTYAGGKVAPNLARADGVAPTLPSMELRGAKLDSVLGVGVPFRAATKILMKLGFRIEYLADTESGPEASIRGASHRPDVRIEEDLIEEVARIRGLDNIPTVLPKIAPQQPRKSGELERRAATTAVEVGLSEALLHAFVAESDLRGVRAQPSVVSLQNPLSADRSVLRTSLTPGLLEALRRSRRRGESSMRLFAIGAIFLPFSGAFSASEARVRLREDEGKLPYEQPAFAALLAGLRPEHLSLKPGDYDVYDAKAIAVEMVERLTCKRAEVRSVGATEGTLHLHPRGAAKVSIDGTDVGVFGPLHPDVIEHFDLDGGAQLIELNLATIEAIGRVIPRYRRIPKLPAITRDLSLIVSDRTPAVDVSRAILDAAGELCESVDVAAEFRGGSVPQHHRSLTFRVVYRDPKARTSPDEARTLTDKEVEAVERRALTKAASDFGATLRE